MSYLSEPDASDPVVADVYEADRARLGYVANFSKVFALRPEAYEGWKQLNAGIKRHADPRLYELATVAAARTLRSSYCALAHGTILADDVGPEPVERLMTGDLTGLDPRDAAVVRLAEKVAAGGADIEADDLTELRNLGCSDPEILDVIISAAARCFFSTVLDASGAEPDAAYANVDPDLRTALTVGRPIESAG